MRTRAMIGTVGGAVLAAVLGVDTAAAAEGLRVPAFDTVKLDNGLTVQVMRHAAVPLVSFDLWIPAGAIADPAGKEGLANLVAEALRKGAGDRDAAAFAQALDFLGASFSASVNHDRVRVSMSLLAKDFDAGLALFADAVLRPRFDEGEIAKLAGQLADGIVQAKDNPRNVLSTYHQAFLYGNHPYASPVGGTETSLAALTRADAATFYRERYVAAGAVLTVAGDLDPATAAARLRAAFGAMPGGGTPPPPPPTPVLPPKHRVLLVNKTDTPQTWFMIGNLGPAFGEPDWAATSLVQTVFGGRFTSWLNTKLRIESGLTYGARFNIQRARVAGPASISSFTATETTKQAIDLALAQLDRLHTDGLSDAELASAKAYFKGQTPYDFETAADLAAAASELTFYGLDRSVLDRLFAEVDAVTLDDCRRVVGKYFRRDALVFTTIGVAESVKDILAGYGELRVRENGDPGFR